MLTVHVELLTGRYAATAYNDRAQAEWPPHPARLYSAWVDALHSDDEVDARAAQALDELASWPPPVVHASAHDERRVMTHFVPVNDEAVTDHARLAQKEQALREARVDPALDGASDKARTKAIKALDKARDALATEAKRQAAPIKPPKNNPGPSALPWGRTKQARFFPVAIPHTPTVRFEWPDRDLDPALVQALGELSGRVVRLGHSSCFVAVRCHAAESKTPHKADEAEQMWIPDEHGDRLLRVPQPEQRQALEAEHARHGGDTPGRVMPARHARYRVADDAREPVPSNRVGGGWIAYRFLDSATPTAASAVQIADAVRGAVLRFVQDPVPATISGHDSAGPLAEEHLAIVPLPFVGRPHADGHLRGFALCLAPGLSRADERALLRGLARWESEGSAEGDRRVPVYTGKLHLEAERVTDPWKDLVTLRASRWARPSDRWATATPIALDGECPALNHSKGAVRRKAHKIATRLVARAASRAVHGAFAEEDIGVALNFDAPVVGAPHLRNVPYFQRAGHPRPRRVVHAVITFPNPVRGPLLLGAGRHFGLGLCLPLQGTPRADSEDSS